MSFSELVEAVDRVAIRILGDSVVVTYTPTAGPPTGGISGIFDKQYVLVSGQAEAGVEARAPAVFVRVADLPVDPTTDNDPTVTIGGTAYRVVGREPDDMGGIVLVLRKRG